MPGSRTIDTDALVIGAGPVGLFQVFQLGLLALHAEVVDALPQAGGQCMALYADKPLYDIPGLPVCTGRELTERLLTQISPFTPGFHFRQCVTALRTLPDGRFELHTERTVFRARTVFIAAGVGAFLPRSLPLPGLEAFRGTQVFEGYAPSQPSLMGEASLQGPWVVTGQDDAALETALDGLARGHAVTLVHRRDQFTASPALQEAVQLARTQGRLQFIAGQVVGWQEASEAQARRLTHVKIATSEGTTQTVAAQTLLACLGLAPQLGILAEWGLALSRRQLVVDPAHFETSVPGIFAVGDVNSYPGKKKLILCGFHEATLAAHRAAEFLNPGQPPGPLLYTTSSPKLQRLLGVLKESDAS